MKKYQVISLLMLANLFWAGNYVFGKYVVSDMTPVQMTFTRWLIAIILLFPIAHWVEHPDWKNVWKQWKSLLILSILGIMGYNLLLYEALRFTTSMNAALVNSMNPALIVLFSVLFLSERISLTNGVGLFISLIGVLLVLTNGQLWNLFFIHYNLGDLIMIAVILLWTFYTIYGKRMHHIPPITSTAITALMAVIILFPFILSQGYDFHLSKQAISGIIYIGLFPSVGSFIFWNASVRHIGASKAGIYLNLITVFTAIISILLGKGITLAQIIGGLLVFLGVYLSNQKVKPKAEESHQAIAK
ncbi:DMT family transporter [Terrilactibacillus laevilacticus]|uniref:DMT family transporter n=1 Tax=Terrilactibacillus laevilacticus TaxID=1380157 RepID=A0ABW5PL13_9BACI|nr:DMT family transporter [Terrilactibacillus laevilacticus]